MDQLHKPSWSNCTTYRLGASCLASIHEIDITRCQHAHQRYAVDEQEDQWWAHSTSPIITYKFRRSASVAGSTLPGPSTNHSPSLDQPPRRNQCHRHDHHPANHRSIQPVLRSSIPSFLHPLVDGLICPYTSYARSDEVSESGAEVEDTEDGVVFDVVAFFL